MADYSNNIVKYSNTAYVVTATISPDANMPSKTEDAVSLDGYSIEEISYTSSLNSLVITGRLICTDKYGRLDKLLDQQQGKCDIMIAEAKKQSDGQFSSTDINEKRNFTMSFIINSIKILDRTSEIIKYDISLISLNWYSCIANLQYSNHDKEPQSILDIVKDCITQQGLKADDTTFGKVKTNVKMNYISKLNDNLFTAIPYLMHKLFFLPDRDESIKFIYYDWFNKMYKLLDLADKSTIHSIGSTIMSFFKSDAEYLIQQEPSRLGSFDSTVGNINEYKCMFAKDMYAYDIQSNSFVNFDVKPKNIVQYMNTGISYDDYAAKYHEMDLIQTLKYFQSSSYWNASLNVYNNALQSIIENGSIVINVTGDIMLQCGSLYNISLDRDIKALTTDDISELEKLKTKYKIFEGPWLVSSVISMMRPIEQTFRQNVALFRNYTMKEQKPENVLLG